ALSAGESPLLTSAKLDGPDFCGTTTQVVSTSVCRRTACCGAMSAGLPDGNVAGWTTEAAEPAPPLDPQPASSGTATISPRPNARGVRTGDVSAAPGTDQRCISACSPQCRARLVYRG